MNMTKKMMMLIMMMIYRMIEIRIYRYTQYVVQTHVIFQGDATNFGRHIYAGGIKVDVWLVNDKVRGGTRRLGVQADNCLPLTEALITGGPGTIKLNNFVLLCGSILDTFSFF